MKRASPFIFITSIRVSDRGAQSNTLYKLLGNDNVCLLTVLPRLWPSSTTALPTAMLRPDSVLLGLFSGIFAGRRIILFQQLTEQLAVHLAGVSHTGDFE